MTKRSNHKSPPTPTNGYQRRRQETRRLLLEAGSGLFVERGVERVSIDAITSTAGVAKGSFYNHFESREALLEELIESTLQDLLERRRQYNSPDDDPLEQALARTWYTFYTLLCDPTACRLLLQAGSPAASGAIDRVMRMTLGDELKQGIALGGLSHLDPDLVYAAYFGVVTTAMGHLLAREEGLDVAAAADQLTELCFAVMGLPHHPPQHYIQKKQQK